MRTAKLPFLKAINVLSKALLSRGVVFFGEAEAVGMDTLQLLNAL
jgi:hypothetical protein